MVLCGHGHVPTRHQLVQDLVSVPVPPHLRRPEISSLVLGLDRLHRDVRTGHDPSHHLSVHSSRDLLESSDPRWPMPPQLQLLVHQRDDQLPQ